jgi:hypothetical protein
MCFLRHARGFGWLDPRLHRSATKPSRYHHDARGSAIVRQGRRALRGVGYEPEAAGVRLERQRRHCIQQRRCFAAEVWDAKGLASLPGITRCPTSPQGFIFFH